MLEQLDIRMRTMNLHPNLTPHTKMTSKWTVDLNVKSKAIKLPEKNMGKKFCDLGVGKDFSATTPNAGPIRGN